MYKQATLDLINSVEFLPISKKILEDTMSIIDNHSLTPEQLAEIISKDQAAVAKILALANSPVYGLSKKVSTIEIALILLGIENIKEHLISIAILANKKEESNPYFLWDEFNKHCYLTAHLSQIIAGDFNYRITKEAFVAGLLQDIGIPIIHQYLSDEFRLISELKFYRKFSQTSAEKLVLGKTHEDIGALLLEKWNYPENLIDSIKYHHKPSEAKVNPKLAAIVHLANHIISKNLPSYMLNDENEELDPSIIKILNIPDETYLHDIINNLSSLVHKIENSSNVEGN